MQQTETQALCCCQGFCGDVVYKEKKYLRCDPPCHALSEKHTSPVKPKPLKGMVISMLVGTAVVGVLLVVVLLTDFLGGAARLATEIILGVLLVILLTGSVFCVNPYTTFSYNGKKQLARGIIDKVSDYVVLPENGIGLDVGCGSGALTIACAKKNRKASMIGLDRWGKEYFL